MNGYDYARLRRIEQKAEEIAARIEQRNARKADRAAEQADQEADQAEDQAPSDLVGGMDPYDTGGQFGPHEMAYHRRIGWNRPIYR